MSVGIFHSFRGAFIADFQDEARELRDEVNKILVGSGLEPIDDPHDPPHVCDGRIDVDHIGERTVRQLGKTTAPDGRELDHLQLLDFNPYRVVYVPRRLTFPVATEYFETFFGERIGINLGSSHELITDLGLVAPMLGIMMRGNSLRDDEVAAILGGDDPLADVTEALGFAPDPQAEHLRLAWLLMHEAAMLSIARDVPVVLGG